MNGFRCNVTGTTFMVPVATSRVPRRCRADPDFRKPDAAPWNCAYDILATGGEQRASLISLPPLPSLFLTHSTKSHGRHIHTDVRRRARSALLPRLVRLRGRRAGGHIRWSPAGVRRAGCVDGVCGAQEGLGDDEYARAGGTCDCDCGWAPGLECVFIIERS